MNTPDPSTGRERTTVMSSASPQRRARGRLGLPAALAIALVGLLCAGILAMHHLAGGGHSATVAMAAPSAHSAGPVMAADPAMSAMNAVDPAPVHAVAIVDQMMGGHTAGACLTVLLGGLLVLLYAVVSWQARRTRENQVMRVRTGGPRPGRGPPRDLLAQLCVLRT